MSELDKSVKKDEDNKEKKYNDDKENNDKKEKDNDDKENNDNKEKEYNQDNDDDDNDKKEKDNDDKENNDDDDNDINITIEMSQKDIYINSMHNIKKKLNKKIGFWWWKSYVASAFWSNIATPLNLSLSIITLLTTGQASSKSLFSDQTNLSLSIAGLIISIFNSFFSPHQKMNDNIKMMNQFRSFGEQYENLVNLPVVGIDDVMERLKSFISLSKELNKFLSDTPENRNFLTDLIHFLVSCCAKDKINIWLNKEEENW